MPIHDQTDQPDQPDQAGPDSRDRSAAGSRPRHLRLVPDGVAGRPDERIEVRVDRDLPPAARRAAGAALPSARRDRGVTTAEYAVATAAGAGFAGLLFHLLTGGLGERLIGTLFDHALALLGVG